MTPPYLNSSPSPFQTELIMNEDHQSTHPFLSPNSQASSSSCSLSCNVFFGSATQDQSGFYHRETRSQHQLEADNFGAHSYDQIENENNGLKFSIWKKEVITNDQNQGESTNHQVKWMSSKMRVMLKMKKPDPTLDMNVSTVKADQDDQKLPLSPVETDNYSSNSSSSNNPIRVCSDCNTTKTPLWRSGPRGPKSLCNACGIRQRKARRAMAAAAAAESGTMIPAQQASPFKAKLQPKDKKSPTSGHITKYKKKCKPAPPPSSPGRKNCFEDFLISLSKNSAFHRVFPQDEKEAAILLMALSCGYVHG